MGKETGISWTDSTFNGWIGCTKVADECKFCYAERDNNYRKWNGGVWGPGTLRKLTAPATWRNPFEWNNAARGATVRPRAFGFSLADIFDAEAPLWPDDRKLIVPKAAGGWTAEYPKRSQARDVFMLDVVQRCTNMDWLLLTKRFGDAANYYENLWGRSNDTAARPWPNVWPIFSAGTQANLDVSMFDMAKILAVVNGISAEPLLGPMDFSSYWQVLNWVIVGGESGAQARPMHINWVRAILEQCRTGTTSLRFKQSPAFFFKQWGEWIPLTQVRFLGAEKAKDIFDRRPDWGVLLEDGTWEPRTGPYTPKIAEAFKTTELDNIMLRVGKPAAGDIVDGKRYQQFPVPRVYAA